MQIRSLLITLDLWDAVQDVCSAAVDKQEYYGTWNIMDQKALAMINLSGLTLKRADSH